MENLRKEHILAGLSSAPSNARILRSAAKMAAARGCRFTALYVQTPQQENMSDADRSRLREHTRLAEQLGAAIDTVLGDDIAYQIAEYARLHGVTAIVVGKSPARHFLPTLTDRLERAASGLDLHIIPDADNAPRPRRKARPRSDPHTVLRDLLIAFGFLIPTTAVCHWFEALGMGESNLIMMYLLGVLITSVFTRSYLSNFFTALGAVLFFNYFFTEPRFTLKAYAPGYPITFLVMLLAGLITGSMACQWKRHARRSAQAAYRTHLIFETNQLLQKAASEQEIYQAAATQLEKLLDRGLCVLSADGSVKLPVRNFRPSSETVRKVLKTHRQRELCYPIGVNDRLYAVVDIDGRNDPPDAFQNSVLLSILGECALALENIRNAREKEEAKLQAENEKLRANLLRSISHDLRTPLTSISGNAGMLLSEEESLDSATRKQMYGDIYDDSLWLITLVENLLAVTRIEQDRLELKKTPQLVEEIVEEAMLHISRKRTEHEISVVYEDEFVLALCDARLIVQVVINLIDNAIKHTPVGSHITVRVRSRGHFAEVSVEDDGEGVADKDKIFHMFYTGDDAVADSRRSLGLGLSLCRAIVDAHGGELTVSDNVPHGAIFTFTIPSGEVTVHE